MTKIYNKKQKISHVNTELKNSVSSITCCKQFSDIIKTIKRVNGMKKCFLFSINKSNYI